MKKILIIGIMALLLLTGCANTGKNGMEKVLGGTEWQTDDDSYLVIDSELQMTWYRYKEETEDNYFRGTLQVYSGEEAITFLTGELKEYGVTEEELIQMFDSSDSLSKDRLMCWKITYDSIMVEGEEMITGENIGYWFGFMAEGEKEMDMINMITGMPYPFVRIK